MTEVWFYHLDGLPVERALPPLLEKSLARGWKAVVQASDTERVEALDASLWTYDDASFMAHGTSQDGDPDLQPVYLTQGSENPNGAAVRFFIGKADIGGVLAAAELPYSRAILIFDGRSDEDVADARRQWTVLKAAGHQVSYWQRNEDGRWDKRG